MGVFCCGCWCTACLFADNASQITGQSGTYIKHMLMYGTLPWTFTILQNLGITLLPGWASGLLICAVASAVAGPMRQRLRAKYGLQEEPCNDYLVHFLCSSCGVCQEARELRARKIRSSTIVSQGAYMQV